MFGLRVERPRLFEANWPLYPAPARPVPADEVLGIYGRSPDGRRLWDRNDGSTLRAACSLEEGAAAMGIDWMTAWEDVTEAIRTPEVSARASQVAARPEVRDRLVALQREMIRDGDYVAEGRDIGTVVAPDAELKVFLTASPEERAQRRAAQTGGDPAEVLAAQIARDERDTTREHSPLQPAPDALLVDTTGLSVDEVVDRIARLVQAAR
ncbi:MAG: (d)CMP kinase [Actinobacteria bacterium]|nr:(d)CMP kinase [Actinomycetota bacterium]